ncbi:unnamed protein product [Gongylonema pulchrum]|uniref:EF-1_beta_acid domain-containing protein n=1 Tax=Gongylonema pulchrum TaxID=637853 RepID=A0A183DXD6_9BILA|nr:unnamed protein product [Gongylonema pulchrum]
MTTTAAESLLPEVTAWTGMQTVLRAADQLFFGDTLLQHSCSNEAPSSHRSFEDHAEVVHHDHQEDKGKGNKKAKREKHHEKAPGAQNQTDGLREAIASAKETVKEALKDKDGSEAAGALLELKNEVATLKKSSDDMKRELEKLRGDFQNLLKYVQQSSSEHAAKYPSSADHYIAEIQTQCPRVHVIFSVDACSLPEGWNGFFDDVIWNFPHHCGKTNLRKSRQLMRNAFRSIQRILGAGSFHLTLAQKQSGLDFASINEKRPLKFGALPEHQLDSWQIAYLAADENLLIREASPFCAEKFSSYVSSGYHNSERSFHFVDQAETLTFVRSSALITTLQDLNELESRSFLRIRGIAHEWRPFFGRDLSILYRNPTKLLHLERVLFSLIDRFCGHALISLYELENLRTQYEDCPNRIYRLTWQTWRLPLTRTLCNSLHEGLKCILSDCFVRENLEMIGSATAASATAASSESQSVPSRTDEKPVEEEKNEDFDLFGSSDEEDAEKERERQERLKEYAQKKAKKPQAAAKSSIILDVKNFSAKLIPLAYGIKVLQIICVVEDEKVSVDDLIDQITEEVADHVRFHSCYSEIYL